jgi:putative transposase
VAVRRLLPLRREGKLTTGQVRPVVDVLGVRELWRWLAAAERDEAAAGHRGSGPRIPGGARLLMRSGLCWGCER